MLLKDAVRILLDRYDEEISEEARQELIRNGFIFNRIIGTNVIQNISYANTLPTMLYLKDYANQKELLKYVGPDTRGKRFCRM